MTENTLKRNKKHTGHYKFGWYLWELITEKNLTIDRLADIQEKEGYPLNPYGFYSPKKYQRTYKSGKKEYRYTWKTATSSD